MHVSHLTKHISAAEFGQVTATLTVLKFQDLIVNHAVHGLQLAVIKLVRPAVLKR